MKIPSDSSPITGPLLDSASRIDALSRGGVPAGGTAATDRLEGPAPASDADPAEAMLGLDVWAGVARGSRFLDAGGSGLQTAPAGAGDAAALADRLADSVLAALGDS